MTQSRYNFRNNKHKIATKPYSTLHTEDNPYIKAQIQTNTHIDQIFSDYKFVFVAGLHKSGTSTLFRCLRENPSISGFKNTGVPQDEGQFLQTIFPPAKEFGGPGRFGFSSKMHLTENSSLITDENKEKLFSEWAGYWDTSKPVLIEKSPPNLLKTRFLQAIFPRSYFVVITRHPIITAYATQKWSKTPIRSLLNHWIFCHNIFFEDKRFLKNCLVLKYENFVEDAERHLKQIYEFIGIENWPNGLEVRRYINRTYYEKWVKETEQLNCLKKILLRLQLSKTEKEINKFGYSLYDLTFTI